MSAGIAAQPCRSFGLFVRVGSKALLKSLILSLATVGPGFLLMAWEPLAGMIWLLLSSFALMAWSYRKPWRMMWVSCLVPPLASVATYGLQLACLGGRPKPEALVIAATVGIAVGLYRGRVHQVYVENGALFARRTAGYLLAWLLAYGCTQFFSAVGRSEMADVGRIAGGFTTAMLLTVYVVLLGKYARRRDQARTAPSAGGWVMLPLIGAILVVGLGAAAFPLQQGADQVLAQLISTSDIPLSASRVEVVDRSRSARGAQRDFIFTWNLMVGSVERFRKAYVSVFVGRFDSSSACLDSARSLLAEVGSGTRRDSRMQRVDPRYYSDVQRLGHGDLSFAWMSFAGSRAFAVGAQGKQSHASAYSGCWRIAITVGNSPPTIGSYGTALTEQQRKVVALRVLDTAYSRLRGMGLGGEQDRGFLPAGGAGSSSGERRAAAVAAIIAMILVAGGVAVNVANAIATAVANAMQQAADQAVQDMVAAPELQPLINPFTQAPLDTNPEGQYLDPASGRWVDRAEAEIIKAELDSEWADYERDRAAAATAHDQRAGQDWADLRARSARDRWKEMIERLRSTGRLDEFNRRSEATRKWMEESHPEMLRALDKLIGRTAEQGEVTEVDLEALRRLSRRIWTAAQGQHVLEGEDWSRLGANAEMVEGAFWELHKGLGTVVLLTAAGPALGAGAAVGGLVALMQSASHGEGVGSTLENVTLSATFGELNVALGARHPTSLVWHSTTGALTNMAETAIRTRGDLEATGMAGAIGFGVGGGVYLAGRGVVGMAEGARSSLGSGLGDVPEIRTNVPDAPEIRATTPDGPEVRAAAPDAPAGRAPGTGAQDGPSTASRAGAQSGGVEVPRRGGSADGEPVGGQGHGDDGIGARSQGDGGPANRPVARAGDPGGEPSGGGRPRRSSEAGESARGSSSQGREAPERLADPDGTSSEGVPLGVDPEPRVQAVDPDDIVGTPRHPPGTPLPSDVPNPLDGPELQRILGEHPLNEAGVGAPTATYPPRGAYVVQQRDGRTCAVAAAASAGNQSMDHAVERTMVVRTRTEWGELLGIRGENMEAALQRMGLQPERVQGSPGRPGGPLDVLVAGELARGKRIVAHLRVPGQTGHAVTIDHAWQGPDGKWRVRVLDPKGLAFEVDLLAANQRGLFSWGTSYFVTPIQPTP